jgi:hypothetical protein
MTGYCIKRLTRAKLRHDFSTATLCVIDMTAHASTCYMCSAEETSREHAPPQCLFPEVCDIGQDLRRNLITVPSCDEHNSKKSADDEFLRAVLLLAAVDSNAIAKHQFLGKFLRGARRNSGAYSSFFTDEGSFASGKKRVLQLERDRFDKCIDHLARALFFHTFGSQWNLPIVVASPNFYSEITQQGPIPHLPTQIAIEASREFLAQEPILGHNPAVFMYRLRYDRSSGMFAFAGRFYEFFETYCASSKALADELAA